MRQQQQQLSLFLYFCIQITIIAIRSSVISFINNDIELKLKFATTSTTYNYNNRRRSTGCLSECGIWKRTADDAVAEEEDDGDENGN